MSTAENNCRKHAGADDCRAEAGSEHACAKNHCKLEVSAMRLNLACFCGDRCVWNTGDGTKSERYEAG